MKSFISCSTLLAAVYAAAADYSELGANWLDVACTDGNEQSPIDLTNPTSNANVGYMMVDYKDYPTREVLDKKGTLQVNVADGKLTLSNENGDMKTAPPAQFHFHAPSEHTIDGKHHDLEMHIVHLFDNDPDGKLGAVIGIMFDSTDDVESEFIKSL